MKQRLFPFAGLLALALLVAPGRAQAPVTLPEADAAKITLSAVDQPLPEVLAALSTQIGRPILLSVGGQETRVRLSGQEIPFSAAMRLLVRGYDLAAAWHEGTLYVALPKADLERLRAAPTPEAVTGFGQVYGPLLRSGPGPYLDAAQRDALVASIEATLTALVHAPADPALTARLLDAVAQTREPRLTRVVAEPLLAARLGAKDWKGAAVLWQRAYPDGAPEEAAPQGWRVGVGLMLAGDATAARGFLQEARLQGDGWLPVLNEVVATRPPVETVERAAAAYRYFLKDRAATGAEAVLGQELVTALGRAGKADAALELWRATLLPAEISDATVDASLELFQALLVAGGPKRAAPAWKEWYQWDRLRTAFETDGKPALDDARFARLKRLHGVALALGPAPPELAEHVRRVRFLRPRTLRVAAVIDRRIQEDVAWREKAINRVEFASRQFEKEFNLKLEISEFQFWVPRDESGPNGFVEQLRARKAKANADFLIGFVLHVLPESLKELAGKHAQIVGYASPEFGGTMMLRDMAFLSRRSVSFFTPEIVNETSVHELGHAFGALHTDDKKSVMRQGFGAEPAYTFDKYNARVCLFFKEFDFDRGFECFDEGELRELAAAYQDLQGKAKQGNGAEEREAKLRFLLARRLRAQGRNGEAVTQFARVVKIGEPNYLVKQAKVELARLGEKIDVPSPVPARKRPVKRAAAQRKALDRCLHCHSSATTGR